MSGPIFYWPVTTDSSGDAEFGMHTAKFGDGYEQNVPAGINNEKQSWNVVCNGYRPYVIDTVLAFVRGRKGRAFRWTPPGAVQGWYKCPRYQVKNEGGNYYIVTFTFEQTYKPI